MVVLGKLHQNGSLLLLSSLHVSSRYLTEMEEKMTDRGGESARRLGLVLCAIWVVAIVLKAASVSIGEAEAAVGSLPEGFRGEVVDGERVECVVESRQKVYDKLEEATADGRWCVVKLVRLDSRRTKGCVERCSR